MNINYVKGDATYPQGSGTKIIVHCTNTVGAWGAGFVLALDKRWALPSAEYKRTWLHYASREDDISLGHTDIVMVESDIFVANLTGQEGVGPGYGRPPIRYDAIDMGLGKVRTFIQQDLDPMAYGTNSSVHMPRMGAGLAGGDWRVIEALILKNLTDHDIPVTVYDL